MYASTIYYSSYDLFAILISDSFKNSNIYQNSVRCTVSAALFFVSSWNYILAYKIWYICGHHNCTLIAASSF